MKILQINSVYKSGSTGSIMANIHQQLHNSGFESYVAYSRGRHSGANLLKIGNIADRYLHALGTRIFDKHGLYSQKATKVLIDKIQQLDIDVVHLHNIHGYYLNYELLFQYLNFSNKPVVWTLHDCWSFTGHCSHYDYAGCNKWQTHCSHCPQKNRYPASYLLDASKTNFLLKKKCFTSLKKLTLVSPSKWLAAEVSQSFLHNFPIEIINNGIDLAVFKPTISDFRQKHNLQDKFLILGVANIWDGRKGFDYFKRLSATLNIDEKIILVGLNNQQLKALPANIIGIKKTSSQQQLVKIYSAVDVFVNPTLQDNFPTTNIESLACATPVITFNSGGSAECLDKNCGITVEKGDFKGLCAAIQTVKNFGKAKYSSFCTDRAEKYFSKDARFLEYVNLYQDLM